MSGNLQSWRVLYLPHCCVVACSEVFKARDRKTNRIVALKKVRMENEKEGVGEKLK